MNKIVLLFILFAKTAFGQPERELPILGNPELYTQKGNEPFAQKNMGTFDSTFLYTTDTVGMPFFDDFSTDKFQKYQADFSDPTVTFDKKFKLLSLADVPLAADSVFSLNPTYRRSINLANNISVDSVFATVDYKIGSLANYPVTYNSTPVYPNYILIDTLDYPNPIDTIFVTENIVRQDSATQFFKHIVDPSALWIDSRAYHNYRFAVNPWTIGVATFDGINDKGFPYSFGTTQSDVADVLTSKKIDLTGTSPANSVYLSFLYQKQGFGEEPETGDSLILEFYNPVSLDWDHVWSVNGGPTSDFRTVHIPVANPAYFANNFQIRFKSYGSLAGGLDHFHLDYVNLRDFSAFDDTLFKDFAFVYPTGSLLKEYTSVPWDHYKNNFSGKMNDAGSVTVRNGSNLTENNLDGTVTVNYNGSQEGTFNLPAQTLSGGNINYAPRTTYESFHDFSTGYRFDETKSGTKQHFQIVTNATAQFTDPTVNDTTFSEQYFGNYYSYDDGTAERAYNFNVPQGRVAIRFTPYEADSLIGAMMCFVPAVVNAEEELFILTVWDDNGGVPGNVLYEDNLFFPKQPIYETSNNKFVNYFFDDTLKVAVNGTFYIGWRQFDSESLNIGLDKNIDRSSNNFFSLNGGASWSPSQISGSLLVRPIFSTSLDAELGIEEKVKETLTFVLYPNPTRGTIKLKPSSENGIQGMDVYNLQGQKVVSTDENEADLSPLQAGLYLVHPKGSQQILRVQKVE